MAKYTVCFMATGGIDVDANDEDEAIRKFHEEVNPDDIIDNLVENGWEITEVYTQDEGEMKYAKR